MSLFFNYNFSNDLKEVFQKQGHFDVEACKLFFKKYKSKKRMITYSNT